MVRPATKEQLIEQSEGNFAKLFTLIDSITPEQQESSFSFEDRDRNVRDVLIHLYEWHQLLIRWVKANLSGGKSNFLPEPYNWKTYPQMNVGFWEKHQKTSLSEARSLLEKSHKDVIGLMQSFSDEELFTKKYFPWTGTTSLGSYFVSSASSHYDWAIKKIKIHVKAITK